MIFPIVVVGSGIAIGLAYAFRKKKLNPDQQMVYDVAMSQVTEPKKLIKLANVFHQQGYPDHATSLMQRAGLGQYADKRMTSVRRASPTIIKGAAASAPQATPSQSTTTTTTTSDGFSASASGSVDINF